MIYLIYYLCPVKYRVMITEEYACVCGRNKYKGE